MAKTSLVVLVDDPLISQQLGEFLNQVQSRLLQGSASFGMQAPRASLLISRNNKEVERYSISFVVIIILINIVYCCACDFLIALWKF